MVREGYWFGLPPLVLGVFLVALRQDFPVTVGALLVCFGLFVFSFFRNPERAIPEDPGLIVSPADGRVVVVTDEALNGRPGKRVSIFLAIWNVPVNRSPRAG